MYYNGGDDGSSLIFIEPIDLVGPGFRGGIFPLLQILTLFVF